MHPEKVMLRCIELAQAAAASGNYALGSLVARGDEILAEAGSRLIGDDDPSAHPEMVAIRGAAKAVRSRYLHGAALFTTMEPCPMCTSVAVWAKMSAIYFGATQADAMEYARLHPSQLYTWRQIEIPAATIVAAGTPKVELYGGILRDSCRELLNEPIVKVIDT